MPNQADKDGSIEIGDHILEINGVETGTLNRPIAKILPTNPDAPVKVLGLGIGVRARRVRAFARHVAFVVGHGA